MAREPLIARTIQSLQPRKDKFNRQISPNTSQFLPSLNHLHRQRDDLARQRGQRLALQLFGWKLARGPDHGEEPGLFKRTQKWLAMEFSKNRPEAIRSQGREDKDHVSQVDSLACV